MGALHERRNAIRKASTTLNSIVNHSFELKEGSANIYTHPSMN